MYYFYRGIDLSFNYFILTLPLILFHMAILSIGVGLIISALTAKYRDLSFALSFFIQIWMYLTPIVYPLAEVPDRYKLYILINPMTSIVESFRQAFLGVSSITSSDLILSIVISILVFIFGLILFNRVEKTFMDTI